MSTNAIKSKAQELCSSYDICVKHEFDICKCKSAPVYTPEEIDKPANSSLEQVVIETCDQGHKFAKLSNHPVKDGKARCPNCLAIGLDNLRAGLESENKTPVDIRHLEYGTY